MTDAHDFSSIEEEMARTKFYRDLNRAERDEDQKIERERSAQLMRDLAEPFPVEMERTVTKSGVALTYIPVSEVINRLNRIFGVTGWASEILRCERDAHDPDFVVAHVRLTVLPSDNILNNPSPIYRDGIGGQKIKRSRKDNEIIDLGDEMKGAVSDALKKAAQQFGVGLYLARDVEAIEIDEAMHAQPAQKQQEPIVAKDASPYDRFMALRGQLEPDQVDQLRKFWDTWSGGRPVPKKNDFTEEELRILTTECVRLLFGGDYASAISTTTEESDE